MTILTATSAGTETLEDVSAPKLSRAQADLERVGKLIEEAGLVSVLNMLEHPDIRGQAGLGKGLDVSALAKIYTALESSPEAMEMTRPSTIAALRGAREMVDAIETIRAGNGTRSLDDLSAFCADRLTSLSENLPGVAASGSQGHAIAALTGRIREIGGKGALPVQALESFTIRDSADLAHVDRLLTLARSGVTVARHYIDPRRAHNGSAVEVGELMIADGIKDPRAIASAVVRYQTTEVAIDNLTARDGSLNRRDLRDQIAQVLQFAPDRDGLTGMGLLRDIIALSRPSSQQFPHQTAPIEGVERLWAAAASAFVKEQTGRPYSREELESPMVREAIETKLYGCMVEAAAAMKLMSNGFTIVALSAREWNGARLISNNIAGMRNRGTPREFDIVAVDPQDPEQMVAFEVKSSYRALLKKNGELVQQRGQQAYGFNPGRGDRLQIKTHHDLALQHGLKPAIYVHRVDAGEITRIDRPGRPPKMDIAPWLEENMRGLLKECARATGGCPAVYGESPRSSQAVEEIWVQNSVV